MSPSDELAERIAGKVFCLGVGAVWMAAASLVGAAFWTIVASGVLGIAAGFTVTRFWR